MRPVKLYFRQKVLVNLIQRAYNKNTKGGRVGRTGGKQMLDEKDLKAIKEMITEIVTKSEEMLLDEMDRYDRKNERKFAALQKDMDELKGIYRMIKSENETTNILLKTLENHEKRISSLEGQIA